MPYSVVFTSKLPNPKYITVVEIASIDLVIYTMPTSIKPNAMEFKSQLISKGVVITCIQKDVQSLFRETKDKSFVIAKKAKEI
jgi:hypothetical protein